MTLEFLTSDTLTPIRHGFFTRAGGASLGIFAGLNCGMGSCDKNEFVATNRARVAKVMDVAANRLIGVHQVHSAVYIDRRLSTRSFCRRSIRRDRGRTCWLEGYSSRNIRSNNKQDDQNGSQACSNSCCNWTYYQPKSL